MLADMFPSRHMTERLKQMKQNDKDTNNKVNTNNNKVTNNKVTNNKSAKNNIAKKSEAFKKWANQVKSNRRVEPNKKASSVSVVKRRRLNKAIVSESEEEACEAEEEVDESKESEEASEAEEEEEDDEDDSSYREKIISSGKVNVNNPGRLDTKYNIILSVGNPMSRRNNQDDYFQDGDAAEDEETEEKIS